MAPGMPDHWTVYMSVADIEATAEAVAAAGGSTMAPPMDIFDSGRMAVFADDQGSPFAAWQPMNHIGAGRVNDVGCFCWSELATNDLAATVAFYGTVFGWQVEDDHPGAAVFSLGGRIICGAHTAGEGEPTFWSIWFSVADCDASVDRVTSLGGEVMMPPNDMDFGRGAVVAAPGRRRVRCRCPERRRRLSASMTEARPAAFRSGGGPGARPGHPHRRGARRCSGARPDGDPPPVERTPAGR